MTVSPRERKLLEGAGAALAAAAVALLLWAPGGLDRWEARTWDWRVNVMARPGPATDNVRLVLLDQNSLDWGVRENGLSWPWPREVYAPILAYLARAGAQSVAFDVVFTEPSKYGVADDRALADAAAAGGRFVGALFLGAQTGSATSWPAGIPHPRLAVDGLDSWMASADRGGVRAPRAAFPVPEIASRAALLADVENDADADSVFRRVRLFRVFDGKAVPALPLACLEVSSPGLPVSVRGGTLSVAGRAVPIDGTGYAVLRFRGPSGTHKAYSAAAVIQSELRLEAGEAPVVPLEAFRGRHVIFGFSAPGLLDLRPAPVGGVYPGPEIHATALDNLLSGDFIAPVPAAATVLVVLLVAVLAGIPMILSRKAWQSLAVFAVVLPVPALLSLLAYARGWWLPLVVQEAAAALSLLFALAVNYATEGKQKRFIKSAFRQYLSPDVVEQLIAHPELLALGGERRTLSIFFSDLQGFTGISEGLDPQALTALLNDYLTAMSDVIHREGGTIDKYEGDAIIAFWNAPLPQEDHAARAARAALGCQEKLAELRPGFEKRTGKKLFKRIGLHTGPVTVGNMGSRDRFDYTIIGDAANLASRLEGINKQFGTYTMASEAFVEAMAGACATREVSRVAVVGRKEPVRVFELFAEAERAARAGDLDLFARGLAAYYAGKFAEAVPLFESIRERDPVAASYLRKCRSLLESPPASWDGVWTMTEK